MNAGFKACSGDYVIFLSNDVIVCENWVEYLSECFAKYPDCGVASLGNNEHGDIPHDEIKQEMYFAVCMLRKEDAWLDPNYTRGWDDTDLCMRTYMQGKRFYKNLKGLVYHKPHSTTGKYAGDRAEYERCKDYFVKKWKAHNNEPMFRKLAYGQVC
jgi:GT2 family glycosyltransferase